MTQAVLCSEVKRGALSACAQVEFIVAFLGAIYARAVAAPLNPAYRPVSVALRSAQRGGSMRAGLQNEERVLIGLLLAWPGSMLW